MQIAQRTSSFLGHIVRSPNRNLFVNIIEGFINGKRVQGRPRRMWIDDRQHQRVGHQHQRIWTIEKDSTEQRTVEIHDRQPSDLCGRYIDRQKLHAALLEMGEIT